MTSAQNWLDRAEQSLDDGLYPCQSCGKRVPFVQLKEYKGKRLCPSCIKIEKDQARAPAQHAERKPSPAVDMAAIETAIKSAVGEAMKGIDISRIESAMSRVRDDLAGEIRKATATQPPGDIYLAGSPSERRLFFEICKNKKMVGGQMERSYGNANFSLVHFRLLKMWRDDILWKDKHGWYMPNPEMSKEKFEATIGIAVTDAEFTDFMIEMVRLAIQFKFRPFAMIPGPSKNRFEAEIALLKP